MAAAAKCADETLRMLTYINWTPEHIIRAWHQVRHCRSVFVGAMADLSAVYMLLTQMAYSSLPKDVYGLIDLSCPDEPAEPSDSRSEPG